jgi:hypothetical protein
MKKIESVECADPYPYSDAPTAGRQSSGRICTAG